MLLLRDSSFQEILAFLEGCEIHGKDIPAALDPANVQQLDPLKSTVGYEARLLRSSFLQLYNY